MGLSKNIDLEKLCHLIEIEKVQQWKAAEILGCSEDLIYRLCKKHGIKTQRTGPRGGKQHPGWKGGRVLRKGYWHIYKPNHPNAVLGEKYVAEHRLVMEEKLGRYLGRKEVVHHIDGDRQHNHPDNLMVFPTNAKHLQTELKGRVPNWTEEGKETIREASRKNANRLVKERGGFRHIQTTPHSTSKP